MSCMLHMYDVLLHFPRKCIFTFININIKKLSCCINSTLYYSCMLQRYDLHDVNNIRVYFTLYNTLVLVCTSHFPETLPCVCITQFTRIHHVLHVIHDTEYVHGMVNSFNGKGGEGGWWFCCLMVLPSLLRFWFRLLRWLRFLRIDNIC